jgi:glycerol-3-phosphate acyltransferase PlsY
MWQTRVLSTSGQPGMKTVLVALTILLSYLIGCVSTAYYLVRWRTGQDIRKLGSGTAGARNAGRMLGKMGFALVFLGDVLKGVLAVWLARSLGVGQWGEVAAMLAVIVGHLYPFQLGFQGGKGAATGFGAALVLNWLLGLLCVVVAAIAFAATRSFTTSGLVAFILAPVLSLFLQMPTPYQVGLLITVLLLLYTHRDNIRALRSQSLRR